MAQCCNDHNDASCGRLVLVVQAIPRRKIINQECLIVWCEGQWILDSPGCA